MTRTWLDELRPLGALPPAEAARELRAIGEDEIAGELDEAAHASRSAAYGTSRLRLRRDPVWRHTSYVIGHLASRNGGTSAVQHASQIEADEQLCGRRLKVTLDRRAWRTTRAAACTTSCSTSPFRIRPNKGRSRSTSTPATGLRRVTTRRFPDGPCLLGSTSAVKGCCCSARPSTSRMSPTKPSSASLTLTRSRPGFSSPPPPSQPLHHCR